MVKRALFFACFLILIPAVVFADTTVTLAWDANSEADLAGYRIFYKPYGATGFDYGSPVWEGVETTCTVTVGGDGEFVARAFDEAGNESVDSDVVVLDGPPGKVRNLLIQAVKLTRALQKKLEAAIDGLR